MVTSNSQITLRLANTEDIPALSALIDESVRALSVEYYTPDQIESALTHVFGVDTQLILDQTYFVAEADGQVVGAGGWSRRNTLFGGDQAKLNENDSLLTPGKQPARLRAFYVHPGWSRRGIGRLITQACETAAVANGFTELELISTLPGQPLYTANGYEIVCPFEIPLPDGSFLPAFRMSKDLMGSSQ
ncbi:MAG TPA: GNAT family N-acetyltransferase [Pyrinomonadaceae bacterium]|nr:GNAT family N-acetyltransferase [Pyrinomonadaceae bacterium]